MPKASFFFFLFFSPFSFPDSSPGVSVDFSFLLGFPSGEVRLLRFADGFSAKNLSKKGKTASAKRENEVALCHK